MKTVIASLQPYEFELLNGEKLKVIIDDCTISPPRVTSQIDVKERRIFPSEARQRAVTYSGNCSMSLGWYKNGVRQPTIDFDLGPIPVMIRVSFQILFMINKLKKFLVLVARLQPQQVFSKTNGRERRARVWLGRLLCREGQREAHSNAADDEKKLSAGAEARDLAESWKVLQWIWHPHQMHQHRSHINQQRPSLP